jgi:hypothetical protein
VALEKLEWELKVCNTKIEGLEVSTGLLEFEMSSLMQLFEKLYEDSSAGSENLAITSLWFDSVLTEVNCNFFCSIFKIFFSMHICLKSHLHKRFSKLHRSCAWHECDATTILDLIFLLATEIYL